MDSLHGPQYWVLSARNGEEACGLFNEHWPIISLLMTEVVLPGMDGLALASRARDVTPGLPVLYTAKRTNCQPPCVRVWRIPTISI